jgi:hypothetical protein
LQIKFSTKFLGDPEVIFVSAPFPTRMPRPDRMEFDRTG